MDKSLIDDSSYSTPKCSPNTLSPSHTSSPRHDTAEKDRRGIKAGPSAVGTDKAQRSNEEAEADDETDGLGRCRKKGGALERPLKKRGRSITATQPPLKRRARRPRISSLLLSPSSSENESEMRAGRNNGSLIPAKEDGASNFRTPTSSVLSAGPEHESSKHFEEASKEHAASQTGSSPPSRSRITALEEQDWEITKIVGKRRAGKGFEYRVEWKDTWLPKSELKNARRLLQEFEARGRLQRDLDLHGPARTARG